MSVTSVAHRFQINRTFTITFILHVIAPLAIGACIYLFFRTQSLLIFRWTEVFGLAEIVALFRATLSDLELPSLILYSLPDGIWAYSATTWLVLYWRPARCWAWFLMPVALAVTSEIGQAVSVIPGTFEFSDIAFYVAGFLLALVHLR